MINTINNSTIASLWIPYLTINQAKKQNEDNAKKNTSKNNFQKVVKTPTSEYY